ncbi:energy-coupling factor transporter transmembrane component T [Marinovum sp.]|uniref:energy-coupling factor transporter transmembrane component T family protein n=1 Tax=Marinovum sp. TaxID=2024839 RepID=UPI002B26566A|nr:energy-coupling factor transporter transmembrane component T [Marinovum sp.]
MISLTSPVRTRAHDWPAGVKLAALCGATLALFFIDSLAAHLAILAGVLALYALPGRAFLRGGLAALRMLWPFVLVVALYHLIDGSAAEGAVIVLRLVSAVALANLVTMTTRLTDMIAVIHWLCTPLRALGVSTRPLEIAIALVIRLTPVLLVKGRELNDAWLARSPRRATWRIILPFTLLALDDADHISDALRARGGLVSTEEN